MALSKQEREQVAFLFAQGKKRCSSCGAVKDLDDFYPSRRVREAVPTGRMGVCIDCSSSRAKADRLADPAKYRERYRRYQQSGAARERDRLRSWRAANPEKYRAQQVRSRERRGLYFTWWMIKQRCENPAHGNYRNYGARGIALHPEWHSFKTFEAWIAENLGPRPEGRTKGGLPEYTLDRYPDKDGNYEPGNVRWADRKMQYENSSAIKIGVEHRELVAARKRIAELEDMLGT